MIGKVRLVLILLIGGMTVGVQADDAPVVLLEQFSEMAPGEAVTGWLPLTFDTIESHTRYRLVEDAGQTVLRADSHASASGLVRPVDLDPARYSTLSWRWKVSRMIDQGDGTQKSGNDYAAQIFITFAEPPGERSLLQLAKRAAIRLIYGRAPPSAALAYVWDNRAPVGSVYPNPNTDRVRMIVVEGGSACVDQWRSVRRDIVDDFQRAFGVHPPRISGVAIMTDSDNTGESATAWYGDIRLGP